MGYLHFSFNLAKEKKRTGTKISVLRAANTSPFLSEKRAKLRGRTSAREWQEELNRLQDIIVRLRNEYQVNISERFHSEPYLWKFSSLIMLLTLVHI